MGEIGIHRFEGYMKSELDTLWLSGSKKEMNMKNEITQADPDYNYTHDMATPFVENKSQGDPMLMMIERLAANKDVDITKMQALLDMRNKELERMDAQRQLELARQAKHEFNIDYVPMSNELPLITKAHFNTFTTSKYAKHEDINEAIKPILVKYGFALSCEIVEQTDKNVVVSAVLIHKEGHEKSLTFKAAIDNVGMEGKKNKTDLHGMASAITYAKRIAICTLLNISTGDDKDGNVNNAPSYITSDEVAEIEKQLIELKINKDEFLKYMNVEAVEKIEFRFRSKAMNSLNAKRKQIKEDANA